MSRAGYVQEFWELSNSLLIICIDLQILDMPISCIFGGSRDPIVPKTKSCPLWF